MRTKAKPTLKLSLRNAGYSNETADKIVNWYTPPEKRKAAQSNR
jgi:hypothetical protein